MKTRNEKTVAYRIDSDDRIIYVNREWIRVAYQHELDILFSQEIVGKPIWEYIVDNSTIETYRKLIARVRSTKLTAEFQIRCDLPNMRRLYQIEISSGRDLQVNFNVDPLKFEPRPTQDLLANMKVLKGHKHAKDELILNICSWCSRFRTSDGQWLEVEEFVQIDPLLLEAQCPLVSHSMCQNCYRNMTGVIGAFDNLKNRGDIP